MSEYLLIPLETGHTNVTSFQNVQLNSFVVVYWHNSHQKTLILGWGVLIFCLSFSVFLEVLLWTHFMWFTMFEAFSIFWQYKHKTVFSFELSLSAASLILIILVLEFTFIHCLRTVLLRGLATLIMSVFWVSVSVTEDVVERTEPSTVLLPLPLDEPVQVACLLLDRSVLHVVLLLARSG